MKISYKYCAMILLMLFITTTLNGFALTVISAENIYGQVAKEIGGKYVRVINILNNPTQDPHLFTITPSIARSFSQADAVVYNGANYDPWMSTLLNLEVKKKQTIINVANLLKIPSKDNPHIWYSPHTMPVFAAEMTTVLTESDPEHRSFYERQEKEFNRKYERIYGKIQHLKQRFQNVPVIATEPIFNYMADSIGLEMHGKNFQINMMNDIPPTISQIKSFEDDLNQHSVHLLIYNNQVINPLTERLKSLAEHNHISVLGVSEMIPSNLTYIEWILSELDALENKLTEFK